MLLAPNGKESNLTPEQYKLVRTPAFKKWFGDWEKLVNTKLKDSGIDESTLELLSRGVSKVIDENGEPLVVYHFTDANFNIFDIDKAKRNLLGRGFYFTTNKNMEGVAKKVGKNLEINKKDVFLKIVNPRLELVMFKDIEKPYDGVFYDKTYVVNSSNQIKLADGTNTTFDGNNPDIRFADGGEITSKQDDYVVYLKYIENGKEIGHLNYYINLEDVMSNYIDKKPYNFKNEVYIEIVEVDKENRGKGIAKKLLNRAISDAKDLNVDVITLRRDSGMGCNIDDPYDTYLKNIYLSLGFIDTWNEKDENESGGEKSACAMHLDLKNIRSQYKDGGIMPNPHNIKIGDYVQYEKWFYEPIYTITGTVIEFINSGVLDTDMQPIWKVKILIDKKIDHKKGKIVTHQKTTIVKLENIRKLNKDGSTFITNEDNGEMGKGGVFDENINVPSTEELIEIVRNVREKKIKEWYELGERVVVGRNDGYWWEISPRETESILARNPSKKKVLEIIKNNPNITEIHFNGSIKTGTKVGEELEIADDFDVVIWKKQEQIVLPNNADIFQEGLSFAYVDDKGKFINVIVNAKDTQRYSQIDETDLSDKYIYVLSYNKENKNTFEYRILKEEFKEGVNDGDIVFTKEKFKDGGDLKVNDMKSEISVSDIDKKYSNLSHKFINKQLMMGIEIEMEHTDKPEVAKKIALDHLNESPYYYQELEKMESRLQKKNVDSHFEDIKRMYDDGGTIDEIFSFKTPSGEKSKLTYIQQVLVRTSAFKNYFGDWEIAGKRYIKDGKENFEKHYKDVSKVIDWTTLEPRVVYHGTRAEQEFFTFDVTREKGVGRPYSYFAHNKSYAENFTRVSQRQDLDAKPFLYECFLNVRNPFMANGQEFTDKSKDAESWVRAIVGRLVWDKYRTIKRDDFTKALESTVESQIGNYIEDVYSARKDKFWKLMARDINKDFKFFLLAYDYDGIFYSEEFSAEYDVENPSQFTYAITIFDARQIKLADGRNTKFDPLNSDIRYADGGATEPIINNTQNENDMNKLEQLNSIMKSGGAIYKDGGSVKGNGKHSNDAKNGGYFEGNSHANGGIKAINRDTGQIIEVEGNEVIINKRSVGDTTKREFEGEMLTNREILSRINESGGGVKFEDGGEMEHSTCGCSGKKYKYGGETLEDYVILHRISKSTSPKEDSQHLIKQVYG